VGNDGGSQVSGVGSVRFVIVFWGPTWQGEIGEFCPRGVRDGSGSVGFSVV